ncbi:PTS sugar transporter subunit IIA [Corticicoccus populi]|uniref:PTS system glucose-specific EIIA component n=1 Tax=Corticicoccus populi TaxID=1812821 RepID=A0ABW5WSL3_9STAP
MFKNLFGKKKEEANKEPLEIKSPVNGKYVKIEDIPDPVFSEKMMGEGFGIEPSNGKVVAPVSGEVVQVFKTNHAVGIKTDSGVEVLIHIGLETVAMEGRGFTGHVSEGDRVEAGDTLVEVDLSLVKEEANSTITPVIITNSNDVVASYDFISTSDVTAGESSVMKVELK